VRKFICL